MDLQMSTRLVISSSENRMPAIAAARGVVNLACVKELLLTAVFSSCSLVLIADDKNLAGRCQCRKAAQVLNQCAPAKNDLN